LRLTVSNEFEAISHRGAVILSGALRPRALPMGEPAISSIIKGDAMIHVTPEAHEKLLDAIKQNQTSMIRINERFGGG